MSVGVILGLSSLIPLSHASENVSQTAPILLASSFAAYSYEGVPCCKKGCCDRVSHEGVRYKVHHKHHHKKHHVKKHHKQTKKRYHKPCYKPKPACGCE